MTEINQNSLASHHSVDKVSRHSGDKSQGNDAHGRQALDDSTRDFKHEQTSGSVNISFNAHMRLRAYQDQKEQLFDQSSLSSSNLSLNTVVDGVNNSKPKLDLSMLNSSELDVVSHRQEAETKQGAINPENGHFSEQMTNILSEVENNIVQDSEPGYRYLVNMLNNYQTMVEDPQQLQEIMRKEEFYLSRRKPFMDSADFQSYSQVLNQFSNIVARQEFS